MSPHDHPEPTRPGPRDPDVPRGARLWPWTLSAAVVAALGAWAVSETRLVRVAPA